MLWHLFLLMFFPIFLVQSCKFRVIRLSGKTFTKSRRAKVDGHRIPSTSRRHPWRAPTTIVIIIIIRTTEASVFSTTTNSTTALRPPTLTTALLTTPASTHSLRPSRTGCVASSRRTTTRYDTWSHHRAMSSSVLPRMYRALSRRRTTTITNWMQFQISRRIARAAVRDFWNVLRHLCREIDCSSIV